MASQLNAGGSSSTQNVDKKRVASGEPEVEDLSSKFTQAKSRRNKKQRNQPVLNPNSSTTRSQSVTSVAEDDCTLCGLACAPSDSIGCEQCDDTYHLFCCGLPVEHHAVAHLILSIMEWKCTACKLVNNERVKSLELSVHKLQNKVTEMSKLVAACGKGQCGRAASGPAPTNINTGSSNTHGTLAVTVVGPEQNSQSSSAPARPYSQVLQSTATASITAAENPVLLRNIIESTIKNINKKKCNIVVSGIVENNSDQHDSALFVSVCRDIIGVDPHVVRSVRIGGKRTPALQSQTTPSLKPRPRLFLVTLSSEQQVSEIMNYAKHLRDAQDEYVRQHIYFNYDITKEEAKLQYERRMERRRKATLGVSGINSDRAPNAGAAPDSNTINTTGDTTTNLVGTATSGNVAAADATTAVKTAGVTAAAGAVDAAIDHSTGGAADVDAHMVTT